MIRRKSKQCLNGNPFLCHYAALIERVVYVILWSFAPLLLDHDDIVVRIDLQRPYLASVVWNLHDRLETQCQTLINT